MTVVIRRNGALNNAAAGLAGGVPQGIALGQRTRALADQEQRDQFDQEQALRKAQIADQELQREDQGRQASADAASELAAPPPDAFGSSNIPIVGQAQRMGSDAVVAQRVGRIAHRMAQSGVPLDQVAKFVTTAQAQHKQKIDEAERKSLTDRVSRGISAGSYFGQLPDGTRVETDDMNKSLKKWTDLVSDPNTPLPALKAQIATIDAEQIHSKFEYKHIGDTVADMQARMAQAVQPQTPGPQNATTMGAADAKKKAMGLAISAYEHFAPMYMRDPEKWGPMEQSIFQQFAQAEQGIAFVDKELGPVTFEAAEQVRRSKMLTEQARQQAAEAQASLDAAKQADIAPAAEDRRTNAEANKANSLRPRGPASGTVGKSPSSEDLYDKANKIAASNFGTNAWSALTDDQKDAETVKQMGRMRSAARGFAAKDAPDTGPSGTPTKEAAAAANAGADSKLASPQLREADLRAHPEKYSWLGGDVEKTKAWIKEGKRQ